MNFKNTLAIIGFILPSIVAAEIDIDTSLSLRGDVWSSDRDLSDDGAISSISTWGRAKINTNTFGQLVGQGWVRALSRDSSSHGRIRELYWRQQAGPVDIKVGRQIIAWGRADGLNPTDYLSPRDFTLLTTQDSDLRHGNEAVNLSFAHSTGVWAAYWFPDAASNTLPLESVPGVIYRKETAPKSSQWALKWEGSGTNIDGSLSYFDGYDPTPDLLLGSTSPQGIEVILRNQRAQVIGADISWVNNGVIWRAESAWLLTNSEGPQDFHHKKPQIWLIGGGEWALDNNLTLGLQATVKHVFDYSDPNELAAGPEQAIVWRQTATSNQTDKDQHGITWRVAKRWLNDTLTAETTGVVVWPNPGGITRVTVDYAINDNLRVLVGAEDYFGPEHSYFGQLQRNGMTYFQLRYGL